MDEDYTEEQADQELAPLNAQLAYVSALSAQQEVALSAFQVQSTSRAVMSHLQIAKHCQKSITLYHQQQWVLQIQVRRLAWKHKICSEQE